ncbi:hypothetical protein V7S43_010405 [Phytophthora oleae]|uniref:C2H2-type domain-containing protein n=1 Tax=Phytophthora oleae TaxID=2107226 RepID=A0ABD3FFH2_9STRA
MRVNIDIDCTNCRVYSTRLSIRNAGSTTSAINSYLSIISSAPSLGIGRKSSILNFVNSPPMNGTLNGFELAGSATAAAMKSNAFFRCTIRTCVNSFFSLNHEKCHSSFKSVNNPIGVHSSGAFNLAATNSPNAWAICDPPPFSSV